MTFRFRWPEHRVTQNRTGASDAPVGRPEHEVTIRSMRYPFTPTGDASSPTIIGDNDFTAIPPTATVNTKAVATDDSNGIELPDGTKIHKRYTVNPEMVRDLDTRLGSRIRDTIQDKSTQRRLKQDTDNAGRAMLKILKAKRDR